MTSQQMARLALVLIVSIFVGCSRPDAARDGRQLLGDLMMLGAGAAWGATTLVIKATRLRGAPEGLRRP